MVGMARLFPPTAPVAGALAPAKGRLGAEALNGVILAALCLPLNLGYAEAAGIPASMGIYATIVPLVVYALFASSRRLVIGPDSTIAAFMAASFGPIVVSSGVDPTQLAIGLAMLVGLVLLAFWVLDAGSIVRFLSKAVLVGFIAGLALEVLVSQIRKIMNVSIDAEGWFREVWALIKAIPDASLASVVVGVGTIVMLRLLPRISPRLPAALIALVVVTVLVAIVDPGGVKRLGEVPSGLPHLTFPRFGFGVWVDLMPMALAIAALTVAEGLLIAKNSARANRESFAPTPELFAMGAANVAAAFTGAMPLGASSSRTAALNAAGSRSQVKMLVAAGVVVLIVLFFTKAVSELPSAALAGMVANAVVSTIEVDEFRRFARVRRTELYIALGCMVGVLVLGPLGGIVVAVLVTAFAVVRRTAEAPWTEIGAGENPSLDRFGEAAPAERTPEGLRVVRPGSSLFFANAELLGSVLARAAVEPGVSWVVLSFERVADVDPTAAEALLEGAHEIRAAGRVLAITRAGAPVVRLLDRYGLFEVIDRAYVYASNRAAEAAYRQTTGL